MKPKVTTEADHTFKVYDPRPFVSVHRSLSEAMREALIIANSSQKLIEVKYMDSIICVVWPQTVLEL